MSSTKTSSPRLNVPISPEVDEFITELINGGFFNNRSEYIRHLIRTDWTKNRHKYPMAKKQTEKE